MKRITLAAAAVVLTLGVGSTASAQTAPPAPVVFVAVDAFSYDAASCRITVTGIVQGEASSSDQTFVYSCESSSSPNYELGRRIQSCERMALLAMAKPGLYLFQVTPYTGFYYFPACKLARVNP